MTVTSFVTVPNTLVTGPAVASLQTPTPAQQAAVAAASAGPSQPNYFLTLGIGPRSAPFTLAQADQGSAIDLYTGATPTLPATINIGWWAILNNVSTGAITVTATSNTINGFASLVLLPNQAVMVWFNGVSYETLFVQVTTDADVWAATVGKVVGSSNLASAVAPQALVDAATVAFNWQSGINFTLALTTSRTLGNPTNGIPGQWRTILVTQPVAGAAVLSFGGNYVFPGGVAPIIAAGASQNTRLSIFCRSVTVFEVYMIGAGI
jgi:hypothetical protein